jgi:hypothetical protein
MKPFPRQIAIAIALLAVVSCGDGGNRITGGISDPASSTFLTERFTLRLSLEALSVMPGSQVTSTVKIERRGTYTGAVTLTLTGVPEGVTHTFAIPTVSGSSSVLVLKVSKATAPGVYALRVKGSAAGASDQFINLRLIVPSRVVGAYWYPHWGDPEGAAPRLSWNEAVYTPTQGEYDPNDPALVDEHIKAAMRHGVTLFVPLLYEARLEGFMAAKQLSNIRFSLAVDLSEFGGFRDPNNLPALLDWMHERYLQHPSYYRVNGKPVVFVSDVNYLLEHMTAGELKRAFAAGRDHYKSKYGTAVLFAGFWTPGLMSKDSDNVPLFGTTDTKLASALDAVTLYNMPDAGGTWQQVSGKSELRAPYSSLQNLYPRHAKRFIAGIAGTNARFIPSASPGFNNSRLYAHGLDNWLITRSEATPERFGQMLDAMRKYTDPQLNLFMIEAWNEFSEGSIIEPSVEFGKGYLREILRFATVP